MPDLHRWLGLLSKNNPCNRDTCDFQVYFDKSGDIHHLASGLLCTHLCLGEKKDTRMAQLKNPKNLNFFLLSIRSFFIVVIIIIIAGFSLGLNDRALFCSAPCHFFGAFSKSPLVSSGFHQRYFELEVAESVQLRRKVARFSCITLFASDIAAILDLRHRFRHENEATLMEFEGMSFLQLVYLESGAGIYEY